MSNDDSGGGSDPYGRYRQMEVYTAGMLADQTPEYPIAYEELEARATEVLSPEAYGYVAGGAGAERTAEANGRALSRWRLVPRMLRNVATRDLSTTVFGEQLSMPFLLAPIGAQRIIHEDGDLATARDAASLDVPFVHSTQGSASIEAVAEAMDNAEGGTGSSGTPR
jgi:isopentenyl-diphosphate delta-isomerase